LNSYDSLFAAAPDEEEVTARLTREQKEALILPEVERALAWLQENWPMPSEQVEAVFALWELGGAQD
jgi:hypothetical protein